MRQFRKLLIIGLFVAIGARLYINFFVEGFILTFTAIILGISLYLNDEVHPIQLGVTVAVLSPSMRYVIEMFQGSEGLLTKIYPDVFFYLTYGIVFYLYKTYYKDYKTKYYFVVLVSDFLSNFVELMVRTKVVGIQFEMLQGIFFIAIGRTLIIMLFIYLAENYSNLLVKKEHEKRYQYLMMLSSQFKSEIYFLHKNMNQIESLVGLSHKLKREADDDLKEMTLELSKGVHEIKKDYLRVIRGLEEIYDEGIDLETVSMKDLVSIIEANTEEYVKNKHIELRFKCRVDVQVKDHFYLMSILRNLINNGIDACGDHGLIDVYIYEASEQIHMMIKDTGHGIEEEDQDFIFNTGYSTKFNETGNINRGLGLTLVKEMIEETFKGTIDYETSSDGTSFMVVINKAVLEGK